VTRLRFWPLVVLALLGSCAATWLQFQSLPLDGGEGETVTGLFRIPATEGPHPAVVLLPDCDGISPHERRWGRDLTEAGFVTYVIDSHFTRQVTDGCANPLPAETLVADALGALARLSGRDEVDPSRLAVIGWGRGGDIALDLVGTAEILPATEGVRFVAAFYPTCETVGPLRRPALLIVPAHDPDAGRCRDAVDAQPAEDGATVRYLDLEGVEAGFDCAVCPDGYMGAEGVYDEAAAETAHQALIEALWANLGPNPAP